MAELDNALEMRDWSKIQSLLLSPSEAKPQLLTIQRILRNAIIDNQLLIINTLLEFVPPYELDKKYLEDALMLAIKNEDRPLAAKITALDEAYFIKIRLFREACKEGRLESLLGMPEMIGTEIEQESSAAKGFLDACRFGHKELIDYFLSKNPAKNVIGSALSTLAEHNHWDLMKPILTDKTSSYDHFIVNYLYAKAVAAARLDILAILPPPYNYYYGVRDMNIALTTDNSDLVRFLAQQDKDLYKTRYCSLVNPEERLRLITSALEERHFVSAKAFLTEYPDMVPDLMIKAAQEGNLELICFFSELPQGNYDHVSKVMSEAVSLKHWEMVQYLINHFHYSQLSDRDAGAATFVASLSDAEISLDKRLHLNPSVIGHRLGLKGDSFEGMDVVHATQSSSMRFAELIKGLSYETWELPKTLPSTHIKEAGYKKYLVNFADNKTLCQGIVCDWDKHAFGVTLLKEGDKIHLVYINRGGRLSGERLAGEANNVYVYTFGLDEFKKIAPMVDALLLTEEREKIKRLFFSAEMRTGLNQPLTALFSKSLQKTGNCAIANSNMIWHLTLATHYMDAHPGISLAEAYTATKPMYKTMRQRDRILAFKELLMLEDKELVCDGVRQVLAKKTKFNNKDYTRAFLSALNEEEIKQLQAMNLGSGSAWAELLQNTLEGQKQQWGLIRGLLKYTHLNAEERPYLEAIMLEAIEHEQWDLVEQIAMMTGDVPLSASVLERAMMAAKDAHQITISTLILSKDEERLTAINAFRNAVREGDLDKIRELSSASGSQPITLFSLEQGLKDAIQFAHAEILPFLLTHPEAKKSTHAIQANLVELAIQKQNTALVNTLLSHYDSNLLIEHALKHSIAMGNEEYIKEIISLIIQHPAAPSLGGDALSLAASTKRWDLVQLLMNKLPLRAVSEGQWDQLMRQAHANGVVLDYTAQLTGHPFELKLRLGLEPYYSEYLAMGHTVASSVLRFNTFNEPKAAPLLLQPLNEGVSTHYFETFCTDAKAGCASFVYKHNGQMNLVTLYKEGEKTHIIITHRPKKSLYDREEKQSTATVFTVTNDASGNDFLFKISTALNQDKDTEYQTFIKKPEVVKQLNYSLTNNSSLLQGRGGNDLAATNIAWHFALAHHSARHHENMGLAEAMSHTHKDYKQLRLRDKIDALRGVVHLADVNKRNELITQFMRNKSKFKQPGFLVELLKSLTPGECAVLNETNCDGKRPFDIALEHFLQTTPKDWSTLQVLMEHVPCDTKNVYNYFECLKNAAAAKQWELVRAVYNNGRALFATRSHYASQLVTILLDALSAGEHELAKAIEDDNPDVALEKDFRLALRSGHVSEVLKIIKEHPERLSPECLRTSHEEAICFGQVAVLHELTQLLQKDKYYSDLLYATPLFIQAAKAGHREMIAYLLSNDYKIDAYAMRQAFHHAITMQDIELIRCLVAYKGRGCLSSGDLTNGLILAAQKGRSDVLAWMCQKGNDFPIDIYAVISLFSEATLSSTLDLLDLLIRNGLDKLIDSVTINRELEYALIGNRWPIVARLVSLNGDNKPSSLSIQSALFTAIHGKQTELIATLLTMSTDNKPQPPLVNEALDLMLAQGQFSELSSLLALKQLKMYVEPMLHKALNLGQVELVRAILNIKGENKPDSYLLTESFQTLLTENPPRFELMHPFITLNGAVMLQGAYVEQALKKAVQAGHSALTDTILSLDGANKPSAFKVNKALNAAAAAGHSDIVLRILNLTDARKPTGAMIGEALKEALATKQLAVIDTILQANGSNPLVSSYIKDLFQVAVHDRQDSVIQHLLQHTQIDPSTLAWGLVFAAKQGYSTLAVLILSAAGQKKPEASVLIIAKDEAEKAGQTELVRLLDRALSPAPIAPSPRSSHGFFAHRTPAAAINGRAAPSSLADSGEGLKEPITPADSFTKKTSSS